MKTVLILGCGWVGEQFALDMLNKGFTVYASSTSSDKVIRLKELGIHAFIHDFDTRSMCIEELPQKFDFILTSIPATSKLTLEQINNRFINVQSFLNTIPYSKHIFLSSIGVYPDMDGTFTEECNAESNERLLLAENRMLLVEGTVVYRLGGLFGKNRVFAKYFENRICTTGDQLANFIHLDDVVSLIYQGFSSGMKSLVYNIVAPEHPTKKEVILASATKYGYHLPSSWEPVDSFQKRVDGTKIIKELTFVFKYPSPLYF